MKGAVRAVLALAVASVLTLGAPLLWADAARIIEFSATDPRCPEPAFINARFWQLVGEGEHSAGRAVVTVSNREADQYEFLIEIENGSEVGQRKFSASSCGVGAATAALIIAISLFPERTNYLEQRSEALSAETAASEFSERSKAAGEPPRAVTPRTPAEGAPPLPKASPPQADEPGSPLLPRRRGWRGMLSLGGGVDITSLPAPAAGFSSMIGLAIDRVSIELGVMTYRNQTVEVGDQRGASFTAMTLSGHACYAVVGRAVLGRGSLTFGPCAGVTLVRLVGEGFGAQRNYERVGFFGGPAAGAAARWLAGDWLALRIYAESFISLASPPYEFEGERIHRPGAIGASVFAGPELRF